MIDKNLREMCLGLVVNTNQKKLKLIFEKIMCLRSTMIRHGKKENLL